MFTFLLLVFAHMLSVGTVMRREDSENDKYMQGRITVDCEHRFEIYGFARLFTRESLELVTAPL